MRSEIAARMTSECRRWINGAGYTALGRTAPVFDPALGVETKRVALADAAVTSAPVAAAAAAFPAVSAGFGSAVTRRLRQHGIEPRQACNTALAAWASHLPPARYWPACSASTSRPPSTGPATPAVTGPPASPNG